MLAANVLIVEDEYIVARSIKNQLIRLGHRVCGIADTGPKAIRMTDELLPDLILMDIKLKGPMDGIEATRRIRARHSIPVVFLSSYSNREILDRARLTEPFGYLIKPVQEKELHPPILMAISKSRAEEKLRRAEERYALATAAAGVGIWDWDPKSQLLYVDPLLKQRLGYEDNELPDQPDILLGLVHPDDAPHLQRLARELLAGHEHEPDMECRMIHRNRTTLWFHLKGKAIADEAGKTVRILGTCADVSRRKQLEEERERLIRELREALAQVKKLSGLLPMCAGCKKIRNDEGYWQRVEAYIAEHSEARFSHSLCPDCIKRLYPEYYNKMTKELQEE